MNDELILIGRIGSPWGIQGFNWVQLYTDQPEAAFRYRPWVLKRPHPVKKGQYLTPSLEAGKPKGKAQAKGWVCKLDSNADRNAAEQYKGLEIWVSKSNLPALPEGEVYHHQLMGCRVIHSDGSDYGVVESVLETGANDVLVVQPDPTSMDQQERLIPWLDNVVRQIDLSAGLVQVEWDPEF